MPCLYLDGTQYRSIIDVTILFLDAKVHNLFQNSGKFNKILFQNLGIRKNPGAEQAQQNIGQLVTDQRFLSPKSNEVR